MPQLHSVRFLPSDDDAEHAQARPGAVQGGCLVERLQGESGPRHETAWGGLGTPITEL